MGTNNIELEPIFIEAAKAQFWANRGKAINSYAAVEHVLCSIVAMAGRMPIESASLICAKMNNSRARNEIATKFVKKFSDNAISIFWNSLIKLVGEVDQERNEIVHWASRLTVSIGSTPPKWTLHLVPANLANLDESSPKKTSEDFIEFTKKCDFIQANLGRVSHLLANWNELKSLLEKFQQPLNYPPPAERLAEFQNIAALQDPPPTWAGAEPQMIVLID